MSLDPVTDPTLRIGDAEREHTVAALGRHLSVGRLTMAEFENRLDTAYAATTRAELDAVVADLPTATRPSPPPPPPVSFAPTPWPPWPPWRPRASRASWVPWTLTGVICLLIWTATSAAQGHLHYFWPFWVIGPWGALLLVHTAIARTRPPGATRQIPIPSHAYTQRDPLGVVAAITPFNFPLILSSSKIAPALAAATPAAASTGSSRPPATWESCARRSRHLRSAARR